MRLLRLLPLALALAPPLHAQTAADSALVREVVERIGLAQQFELAGAMTDVLIRESSVQIAPLRATPGDLQKLEASLTRAFLADPQPRLLRAVRDHFATGIVDRTTALARDMTAPDRLQALVAADAAGDTSMLGDRALALRLYRANRTTEMEQRTQEALVDYLSKSRRLRERIASAGLSPDDFLASLRSGMVALGDRPTEEELLGVRYMVGRMTPADLDAALAFGESDAGRYLHETTAGPSIGALTEWIGAWMEDFFVAMFDAAGAPAPRQPAVELDVPVRQPDTIELDLNPSPVRDPLPDASPSVGGAAFDAVDDEPQLIGGLDGLAARLVYPDAARLAAVEGTVYVTFVVDVDGRPRHLSAVGSPDADLRAAAMDVVQASRFTPGRHRGQPVRVRFTLPVRFVLH